MPHRGATASGAWQVAPSQKILLLCRRCNTGETVFVYIRCTEVTVWLLLPKTLIYKTRAAFLTWRTEVVLLAGSILAELCPSDELTDETVSGSAPFRGRGFTELPIPGYAGRQTIDREE